MFKPQGHGGWNFSGIPRKFRKGRGQRGRLALKRRSRPDPSAVTIQDCKGARHIPLSAGFGNEVTPADQA